MKVSLKNYQGSVKKSATVYSNDPRTPTLYLSMEGTVKAFIELQPTNIISFRGLAEQQEERKIDLVSTSGPFHVKKMESSLNDKIAYRLETIEEGKRYRLKVSNLLKQGSYNGYIKCYTDMPKRSEIIIPVRALIEGEIAVRPQSIRVGKLMLQRPPLMGKVLVISNLKKQFKITKLTYDEKLIHVVQQSLPGEPGFVLEVSPNLDGLPPGVRDQRTLLVIETDVNPAEKHEVNVEVVNVAEAPKTTSGSVPGVRTPAPGLGANLTPGSSIPPAGSGR